VHRLQGFLHLLDRLAGGGEEHAPLAPVGA
jgi:hypothetical protein